MFTVKDVFKLDLSGKWYIRVLKVCIALVGAWVFVAVLFFAYGFFKGVISAFRLPGYSNLENNLRTAATAATTAPTMKIAHLQAMRFCWRLYRCWVCASSCFNSDRKSTRLNSS